MHANSLQVAPSGVILMSVRYLDTVMAISPQLDRIAWRIGRFGSNFAFPNPNDKFYHEHYVRMLDNGNLLLFDNGNGRPATEGGQYTRALELALDRNVMTATKVWEYRHQVGASGGTPVYKYSDRVGTAQRLQNRNTIVWFGADVDPTTLKPKSPQTYTLVEADASPEAGAVAVLDVQIPPGTGFPHYEFSALPVDAPECTGAKMANTCRKILSQQGAYRRPTRPKPAVMCFMPMEAHCSRFHSTWIAWRRRGLPSRSWTMLR